MTRKHSIEHFKPEVQERILNLRHDLHRNPELALQENKTADRLERELRMVDALPVRRVAGTGVIARVPGRSKQAPVVAVRGDIDALPIQEETGSEFSSVNDGVMHACGHDVHAAWTVGAALSLVDDPAEGDVLVLLQPAEETAQGAVRVIESGSLDDVSAIVGGHVDMRYPVGSVVAQTGHMAASADEFAIKIAGSGSHAARPHEGRNPVVVGAAMVSALETVVARKVPAGMPAVLTSATFNSGSASNIIPESAEITGTVRAVDVATRELLHDEITRVAEHVAAAFGASVAVDFLAGTPPLVNDRSAVEWVRVAAEKLLGTNALVPLSGPNLGGEDFAFYLEKMPGCFFRVGGRSRAQEATPAHSSRFLPHDEAVLVGAAILAETARNASRALAEHS